MDYGVFDPILDSIFIIDEKKTIIYCNEVAAGICGISVKRLSNNRPIYDFLRFDLDNFFLSKGGDQFIEGMPLTEVRFESIGNGNKGNVQLTLNPFEEDGVKLWTIVVRDVTVEEVLHKKYQGQLVELEAYSKNLETMVDERTAELNEANKMLNAIMESLGQGFVVVDQSGKCSNIRTKICNEILETDPVDQNIEEVLKVAKKDRASFAMWLKAIYEESLPFDSLKNLGPSQFKHSLDKHVLLEYYPIRNEKNGIQNIVVMATDRTSEHRANLDLEKERQYVQMVMKLIQSKKQFKTFLNYIESSISEVQQLNKKAKVEGVDKLDVNYIFRVLHTLEGEAVTYGASAIHTNSKKCQDYLSEIKDDPERNFSTFEESIVNLYSEFKDFLVENESLFKSIGLYDVGRIQLEKTDVNDVVSILKTEKISVSALAKILKCLLAEPLKNYFGHFNDIVGSVANGLGKNLAPITFKNGNLKINGDHFSQLLSSFVHVFRNAVDHGIELPELRRLSGKKETGQIYFEAENFLERSEQWIRFVIRDDGRGIDPEMIKERLAKAKSEIDWNQKPDEEVIQHIFDVGFSSRDEVSDFSGRGIGMSAVKREAEILGGRVSATSVIGQGTTICIEVPVAPLFLELEDVA